MPVKFIEDSNIWIDGFVELSQEHQTGHSHETLFVPQHDDEELSNDAETEDEVYPDVIDFSGFGQPQAFNTANQVSNRSSSAAIVAVDSGVIDLGQLSDGGTVFAIRGAAVCIPNNGNQPFVCRYNTGAIVIDKSNKLPLFHYLGSRLGREDLFIYISPSPPYYAPKESMGETSNQVRDRCRNFVERMIQEEAVGILDSFGGGLLLIDGALSGGTFDTPLVYSQQLLANCRNKKINVVAISKKTRITIGGYPIGSLFADSPDFIGYAPLRNLLQEERDAVIGDTRIVRKADAISIAEEVYATRFTYAPIGITFRTDVNSRLGLTTGEVLDLVYNQCQIYGGYPRPLIEAHQYSSFLFQDVQLLLADVTVRLGVRPQEEPSMEVLFQPFGGKHK